MPMLDIEEGAIIILANLGDCRQFQIHQKSLKRSLKSQVIKRFPDFYDGLRPLGLS